MLGHLTFQGVVKGLSNAEGYLNYVTIIRIQYRTFYFNGLTGYIFFTPVKPGVPISTTSLEPATYAIFTPRRRLPRRVPCTIGKGGVGKPLRLPEHSQLPIKDHRWTSVSGCLPLDNPTYRLLGFEYKFSPPFGFETGARIEPPMTES